METRGVAVLLVIWCGIACSNALMPVYGNAFYAYLSPGATRPLVYDVTITNIGNAFNNHTGVFTVPRDGTYYFTWSTRVECSAAHTTELVVNRRVLGSTYIWCGYNTVTGHVVANVARGNAVFVRTHSRAGKGHIKSDQYGRSAFSGFLIL